MQKLKAGRYYYRRELHKLFKCQSIFTPGQGAWGVQRVVSVPKRANDFIFFETLDGVINPDISEIGICENGILTWPSHPSQSLRNNIVSKWIEHDDDFDKIHLFVNKKRKDKYIYLGTLSYLTHDKERQNPVWFKFQLNNFELNEETLPFISIEQKSLRSYSRDRIHDNLEKCESPTNTFGEGLSTINFRKKILPNFLENEIEDLNLRHAGAQLVLKYEQEKLKKQGKYDLAEKVGLSEHLTGKKAGFDIQSFDNQGNKVFIKVKTTRGNSLSAFQTSHIEINFSKENEKFYRLYRLYEYNDNLNSAKYYSLNGAIDNCASLVPVTFKSRPRN